VEILLDREEAVMDWVSNLLGRPRQSSRKGRFEKAVATTTFMETELDSKFLTVSEADSPEIFAKSRGTATVDEKDIKTDAELETSPESKLKPLDGESTQPVVETAKPPPVLDSLSPVDRSKDDCWKQYVAPTGMSYWHNAESGETTYIDPFNLWTRLRSEDGREFWYNKETKESTYFKPET
jgi:hypothetical protein